MPLSEIREHGLIASARFVVRSSNANSRFEERESATRSVDNRLP